MSDALLPTTPTTRLLQPREPSSPHHSSFVSPLLRFPRHLEIKSPSLSSSSSIPPLPISTVRRRGKVANAETTWSGIKEGPPNEDELNDDAPTSIELVPILGEEQFDRIIAEAQQLEESLIVLWMANWCRKCIYLKPKLEKLAADYHPRILFYCVDVNTVPQRLVNRAGITKMPTIQLWKDCTKQAEVIGGHKAWLVVDEVRRMIENES